MKIAKMSDEDLKVLRTRAKRDKSGKLAHLLNCYLTLYRCTCDQSSDVLEFNQQIKDALNSYVQI